jgi:CSLREA domain-containing protein
MHSRRWMVIGSLWMLAAIVTACGPKGGGGSVVSYTVNTADDEDDGACTTSHCSLREAIAAANDYPGFNKIYFNIPGAGVHIIETETGFPDISDPVAIDGTTQPGYANTPLIELRAGTAHFGTALSIHGGDSTIEALAVVNFKLGIEIRDGDNVWIISSYLGIRPDGATAEGNQTAVEIWSGANHIGGTQLDFRNVISGNTAGVRVLCDAENNLIQNNYIGLDATGTSAVANGTYGVHVCGSNNTIGGTDPMARNVISGNTGNAVEIKAETGHPATGNQIA